MTLSQTFREPEPDAGAEETDLASALARALDASRDPAGGGRREAWRFVVLAPDVAAGVAWLAARRLEPEVGVEDAKAAYDQWRAVPGWIVVTCLRGIGGRLEDRDREACLTAVQRATLSLWSDNIPSNWLPDLAQESAEFYKMIDADASREVPIGVLLYGHPERKHLPVDDYR